MGEYMGMIVYSVGAGIRLGTKSISTQRSIKDYESQQNVSKLKEHMVDEELDQLLESTKNENLEVMKSADDVTITNDDVEEELAGDEFKLTRREKRKGIKEIEDTPPPTPTRSPRTHIYPLSIDKETL
nr:hypothetical protein [Tanacetum cinerariifolium]